MAHLCQEADRTGGFTLYVVLRLFDLERSTPMTIQLLTMTYDQIVRGTDGRGTVDATRSGGDKRNRADDSLDFD